MPETTLDLREAILGPTPTKEQILDRIEGEQIRFINLQFSDVMGIVKSVTITAKQFEHVVEGGQWIDGSSIAASRTPDTVTTVRLFCNVSSDGPGSAVSSTMFSPSCATGRRRSVPFGQPRVNGESSTSTRVVTMSQTNRNERFRTRAPGRRPASHNT